ncbi:hypothetical protein LCGC14_0898260 [marine sediment metagenome]|uniref:Uncharacterized protein n=1 Tax=marine sediment metagenome TaxID=412755 RepID=A0A0F9RGA2_9ZZZZ
MATPVRDLSLYEVSVGTTTRASDLNDFIYLAMTEADYGPVVNLPAAPAVSQQYMATDEDIFYFSFDGADWIPIASDVFYVGVDASLYGAAGDANPVVQLDASRSGIAFGAGVGSALDVWFQREAAGVVAARNAGDSAYAIVRGATPSGSNDLTTKGYVDPHVSSTSNPHSVTAAQAGALASIDGVSNSGGDVNLVAGNQIVITPDNPGNQITIAVNETGLDADTLDSLSSAAFLRAGGSIALTAHWATGAFNITGIATLEADSLQIGATTVVDSSRNLRGLAGAIAPIGANKWVTV